MNGCAQKAKLEKDHLAIKDFVRHIEKHTKEFDDTDGRAGYSLRLVICYRSKRLRIQLYFGSCLKSNFRIYKILLPEQESRKFIDQRFYF